MLGTSQVHLIPQDWRPSPEAEAVYQAFKAVYHSNKALVQQSQGASSLENVAARGSLYIAANTALGRMIK